MSIDLLNETDASVDEAQLVRLVAHHLEKLFVHPDADVSIALVDVAAMEQLHVQWMDEPGPTDVLSFPMDELRPGSHDRPAPAGLLGDIVLCPEVAQQVLGKIDDIRFAMLTSADVVRHTLVGEIVDAYTAHDQRVMARQARQGAQ